MGLRASRTRVRTSPLLLAAAASVTAAFGFAAPPAYAAATLVAAAAVPGVGPQVAGSPVGYAPPPDGYAAPNGYATVSGSTSSRPLVVTYAAPAPAPSLSRGGTMPRGGYGGGFIEMLASGGAPPPMSPAILYNRPDAGGGYGDGRGSARLPTPDAGYVAYAAPERAYAPGRALDPTFARTEVSYGGGQPAGTIIVDTPSKYLYLVGDGGRALRYGIGVGRPGFLWSGVKSVTRKAEWPGWTPPGEMLRRRPDLPRYMGGGPDNPLGARALYLGSSLYRIHGTNEPSTIGQNVSSGCIRMMNEDVVDLYNRVRVGTKVVVM